MKDVSADSLCRRFTWEEWLQANVAGSIVETVGCFGIIFYHF